MSNLFNAIQNSTESLTTNGAVTLPNSGSNLVDLFGSVGSSRGKDLSGVFTKAFGNDDTSNILATRILLWARDVRGGAGERQTFRSLLSILENENEEITKAVIRKIPEIGRWDDMLCLNNTYAVNYAFDIIQGALNEGNALCAKWMPRKGKVAAALRNYMGLSPKNYRKLLVRLTNVVETNMCAKDWEGINYEHVPSVAASRYSKAFSRNDSNRYGAYLSQLEKGEAKVNASAIFPYDVIRGMNSNAKLANAQWDSLPDYLDGDDSSLLCVVDTSGSMMCSVGGSGNLTCMDVALSLGLYVSQRTEGIFKDQFVTFSSRPVLQTLTGSLSARHSQLRRAQWSMSTDFNAVFQLILNAAVDNDLSESDMPKKVLVFSDMEFNRCGGNQTNFEAIDRLYKDKGYKRPEIVFWNLNAREGNSPVRFDENGTALVSGFSPSLMKSILSGKSTNPFSMMLETIMDKRYDLI